MKTHQKASVYRSHAPFMGSIVEIMDTEHSLAGELVRQAATELETGNPGAAESYLQQAMADQPGNPLCRAYWAVCLATRQPGSREAERLARQLIDEEPRNPAGYFALGQIQLLAGNRGRAFRLFAKARKTAGRQHELRGPLDRLEPRRAPVFRSLPRNHPLNILAGKIRALFMAGTRG